MDPFQPTISAAYTKLSQISMTVILFGSNNPTGAAFLNVCNKNSLEIWGRKPDKNSIGVYTYCDLTELSGTPVRPITGILVSFAPIWLVAPFLVHLLTNQPQALKGLKGIIACSSSSFITKRFAFNDYDKHLALKLSTAQGLIKDVCRRLEIPCQILAPTLVYGHVREYADKNISKIIQIMRILPFVILPKTTGLRQPIHATQLAAVAWQQAEKILSGCWSIDEPEIVALGGDSTITYEAMITRIKDHLNYGDAARNCQVLLIPDKLFFMVTAVLLPINPKLFEAIMRIRSDLSDFAKAHEILGEPAKRFPILPLATKP